MGQPGCKPRRSPRHVDLLCALQARHRAVVLIGLGPGNHPGLNRDATFYDFIGVVFVLLVWFFFNLKSSLAGLWKSCSGWSLGWTETTRASPSARASWFYIVQVYFMLSDMK